MGTRGGSEKIPREYKFFLQERVQFFRWNRRLITRIGIISQMKKMMNYDH